MALDRLSPDPNRVIAKLQARVAKLEKQLSQVIDARRVPFPISFSGPLDVGLESPPWRPVHPTEIDLIVPQVLVAPSGADLTIDLTLNGSVVRTLTVPDGFSYSEDAVPFVIPMGQTLTATVTQSGDAESLTIHFIPKLL